MKKKNIKKKLSLSDIIGIVIISIISVSSIYFAYGVVASIKNDDSTVASNQVWCANCQTYHDKETADKEAAKLVWCNNCNKYHAPGEE